MQSFDALLEENPFVQKKMAEGFAEGLAIGKAKGRARGEVIGFQKAVIHLIEKRFPNLAELAQQEVTQIGEIDQLDCLLKEIVAAIDEETIRLLFESLAA